MLFESVRVAGVIGFPDIEVVRLEEPGKFHIVGVVPPGVFRAAHIGKKRFEFVAEIPSCHKRLSFGKILPDLFKLLGDPDMLGAVLHALAAVDALFRAAAFRKRLHFRSTQR